MQSTNFSEHWKNLNWKKIRKVVFRLQIRLFKAMRAGDSARVRNLQNLILRSKSARLLAIRQVTQLNAEEENRRGRWSKVTQFRAKV